MEELSLVWGLDFLQQSGGGLIFLTRGEEGIIIYLFKKKFKLSTNLL